MSTQAVISPGLQGGDKSSGAWAMNMFLACRSQGRRMTPDDLRVCMNPSHPTAHGVLRKDEWIELSDELIEETKLRLNGIDDLLSRGLTRPISNAFGKTRFEWERVSDLEPAQMSLDATSRTNNQTVAFDLAALPLPIMYSDWDLTRRVMDASMERGEALDTTNARLAARKVAELLELTLFQGGPTFNALPIPGYTTHTDRNTGGFSVAAWDLGGATGPVILTDFLAMKQSLVDDGFFGPFIVYIPPGFESKFDEDYETTNSAVETIRDRMLRIGGVEDIKVTDQMPASEAVMVSMDGTTVQLLDGEGIQTVQWDIHPWAVAFKVFLIQVPRITSTQSGDSGIFHIS